MRLAWRSTELFPALLAIGITTHILVQALVNIGALLQLIPLTGIPLPFISYGGSALTTTLIEVGLLLNISRHV